MALLSGFNQITPSTQTFSDWLLKTNEMILMFRGDTTGAQTAVVTANNLPGGSMTYGNATLFGQFAANAMVVFNEGRDPSSNAYANGFYGGLRGGTFDFAVNNFVSDTLYVTTNTTFTDEGVEVFVDSTYGLIVTNFIEARHDVLFVGNSGANTDPQLHWQDNNNTLNWNEEVRAIFGGNTGTDGENFSGSEELSVYGGTDQYEMFYLNGRMYTNTDIQDTRASANLNLITDVFEMRSETGNEMIMTANVNNGVELYWNDQLKFSTNAYGVIIHGDAYVRDDVVINDNQKLLFGTTYPDSQNVETIGVHNLQMYTDGTDGYIVSGETGGGLKIRVDTDFHVQYEDGSNNYITANNDGYSEVVLYASGVRRLETIDGAINPDSVDGVEIYGEANTTTLRVLEDANFDGVGGLNSNNVHWDASANTWNYREETYLTLGDTDEWVNFRLAGRSYSNTDNQDIRARDDMNIITDMLEVKNEANNDLYITAEEANNSTVRLYWDGTEKMSTNQYGIVVEGDTIVKDDVVVFDNNKILMGGTYPYNGAEDLATYNLQIWTDGDDGIIRSGDRDLLLQAETAIRIQNELGTRNYITANTVGEQEVTLYANNIERLQTVDGGIGSNSVNGVEIYGEANTDTLRVQSDANFDGVGGLNSNNVHWDASANTWNYRDATKITLGDSDDWEMFYTAAGRAHSNTDNMNIRARTDMNMITNTFELKSETGTELYMSANVADNSTVRLYYEGNERLQTNTHGVEVTGQLVANGGIVTYNGQSIEMGGANYAAAHNFTIVTNGTDTTITETTNDLSVRVEDNFRVTDDTGAVSLIVANTSGEVTLYHNNDQKLQTNAYGIEVTGEANTGTLRVRTDASFDGSAGLDSNEMVWNSSSNALQFKNDTKAEFGETSTVEIYHDGADGYIKEQGGGNLIVQGNNMVLQTTAGENYLQGLSDSSVTIYYNGNAKLNTTNIGVNVTGNVVSDGLVVDGNSDLNGNIDLGLDTTSLISYIGRVGTDIDPSSNNSYDLGSNVLRWNNLWIGGTATIDELIAEGNATFEDSVTIQDSLAITNDITVATGTINGDGSGITNINADNIASGTINDARLPGEISSNVSGTSAQSNTIEIASSGADTNFPIAFVATAGTYRQAYADSTFYYNTADDELTVTNLVVTTAASLPAGVSFSNTTTFENIIVTDTANLNTLSVTSLEANGVAFTGTGEESVTSSGDVSIDVFEVGQTQGFKYMIHGERAGSTDSGYLVEINVIVTDDQNIYFTRYGEVDINMGTITLTPVVNTAPSSNTVELVVNASLASPSDVHSFKVLKIETRT